MGGWLGALSYCQIVSCWIRVGLVLLSIEGRADVFFVGFSFSQSCGVAPSGVHFVTVGSRLKMDEFCFLQNSRVVSCVASAFWWQAYVTSDCIRVGSCLSCSGELS